MMTEHRSPGANPAERCAGVGEVAMRAIVIERFGGRESLV
jgi:hypothetical protein